MQGDVIAGADAVHVDDDFAANREVVRNDERDKLDLVLLRNQVTR